MGLCSGGLARSIGHETADLRDALGPLQDLELLQVTIPVTAALELEVSLPIRARLLEQLLDALGNVRHGPVTAGTRRP